MDECKYHFTPAKTARAQDWSKAMAASWPQICKLMTDHKEGAKDGPCYTPAIFRNGKRKKEDSESIDLLVLDCDTGEQLAKIVHAVEKKGWKAIIHSTHSHGRRMTEVATSIYKKHSAAGPARFLIERKGMHPSVAKGAEVQISGKKVILSHKPCPKFRIIMPLEKPWKSKNYLSQREANEAWAQIVKAVAGELGLQHDQSCIDTSRLYYFPRHKKGSEYIVHIVEGVACNLDNLNIQERLSPDRRDKAEHKPDLNSIHEMLSFIDPDCNYQTWISIGMALKAAGLSFDIWNEWSSSGIKYRSHEMQAKWSGFDANGTVTLGTIVYHARQEGWKGRFISEVNPKPKKTYQDIQREIQIISKQTNPEQMQAIIADIAHAAFDPLLTETLLKEIKNKTGMNIKTLREQHSVSANISSEGRFDDIPYEIANATLERFYAGGEHIVFAPDGNFWVYAGTHWKIQKDVLIQQNVLKLIEERGNDISSDFNKVQKSAVELLKSKQAVESDVFNSNDRSECVINCRNGELWIDNKGNTQLKPHNSRSYLTYVLSIDYNPKARCPRFDGALLATFSNSSDPKGMARHITEVIGYIVQPKRFITCWFMWFGDGENGKTKLFETIEKLLPSKFIHADRISKLEQSRFAIGYLADKLLLVDDDVDAGTKLPDGMMKKLSERKLLTGEKKFKDTFEFISCVSILLLANNYPVSDDISHGMVRRARIVPFARKFTNDDRDDTLYPYIWKNELSGVLNRAVQGLQRVIKRGGFDEPDDCAGARDKWLSFANPFMGFMSEMIEKDHSEEKPLALEIIKKEYEDWLYRNDIISNSSSQTVRGYLESRGYRPRSLHGRWVFDGVKIRNKG